MVTCNVYHYFTIFKECCNFCQTVCKDLTDCRNTFVPKVLDWIVLFWMQLFY